MSETPVTVTQCQWKHLQEGISPWTAAPAPRLPAESLGLLPGSGCSIPHPPAQYSASERRQGDRSEALGLQMQVTRIGRGKSVPLSWNAAGHEGLSVLITHKIQLWGLSPKLLVLSTLQDLSLCAGKRIRQTLACLSAEFSAGKWMSLELFTICSPLGIRLCSLCLAAGDWSDGAGEDFRPGCHSLPPLLSSFQTPIFNAVSSLPSAATPPGLFHPLVHSACSAPPHIWHTEFSIY